MGIKEALEITEIIMNKDKQIPPKYDSNLQNCYFCKRKYKQRDGEYRYCAFSGVDATTPKDGKECSDYTEVEY